MVSGKNLKFLHGFLFGKFELLKVFGDVLERQPAFLNNKKTELRKSQIFHFSKGVSPLFWGKTLKTVFLFPFR